MGVTVVTLENGLSLLLETIPTVESAAYELLIPGGIVTDSRDFQGTSLVLAELMARGANGLTSKQLSDSFEEFGIRHNQYGGFDRYTFNGNLLSEDLDCAMRILSFIITAPSLPESELESIKSVLLQEIHSLNDEPSRRLSVELTKIFFKEPFGRSPFGEEDAIKKTGILDVREEFKRSISPGNSVLSVAGNFDVPKVTAICKRYFADWEGNGLVNPKLKTFPPSGYRHIQYQSSQMYIALGFPSVPFGDSDYYVAKVLNEILSGGMFGRLFLEVREKRGLCYSVYARHSATDAMGAFYVFSGTTTRRAQDTFNVILAVLNSVHGSIKEDELKRAKANLKASIVMGEEATSNRCVGNANDWWLLKRVRSVDEISHAIDSVSINSVDSYLAKWPFEDFIALTLGEAEIKV